MIGYDIIKSHNTRWMKHHGTLIPFDPPHVPIDLNRKMAKGLLKKTRTYFIRWNEGFDLSKQTEWWHVIKDGNYDITDLSSNTRSKIRRGLKHFDVIPCTRSFIEENAYEVYFQAFARYKTFEKRFDKQKFRDAIVGLPSNVEFWGVFEKKSERIVAFSENVVSANACFYSTIWFKPESLKRYAAYALIHAMNDYYLNEQKFRYVTDGARNISHSTNIHQFLEQKFLFRKAYSRLRVVYAPLVYLFVRTMYPCRQFFARSTTNSVLSKVAVLLEQERIRRACE